MGREGVNGTGGNAGNGGLASLPVANDQLALTPADRNHRIDGLDSGLQWLIDALPVHYAGSLQFERLPLSHRQRCQRGLQLFVG